MSMYVWLIAIAVLVVCIACIAVRRHAKNKGEQKRREELADLRAKSGPRLDVLESLLSLDSGYLMKRTWDAALSETESYYKEIAKLLRGLQSDDKEYGNLKRLCEIHENLRIREERNERYKQAELEKFGSLLSNINGHSLDAQQRKAVVTDEYSNLVIAGAGSGKSLAVVGKVKYLVEGKGIDPADILVTSFTRASVSDLARKISDAGIDGVAAKTFHKIGLEILGEVSVANENALSRSVQKYLSETLAQDSLQAAAFIEFFGLRHLAECGREADVSAEEHMAALKAADLRTLKGMVSCPDENLDTFQGERVKSVEELLIANFLFLNGVEYEYEKAYTAEIPEDLKEQGRRAYQPDFYLVDYDIWLEHFGINASGRPEWIKNAVEQQKYVDNMKWKREVHQRCGTKLIESYSYWNEDQNLLNKVSELLTRNGVELKPDPVRNAENCRRLLRDRSFYDSIGKLLSTFISLAKSNNESPENIGDRARERYRGNGAMWRRFELFMTFAEPIMKEYTRGLREKNEVDFDDMINLAADKVREKGVPDSYKYIIVDEYQDISKSRLGLILAIREKTDAKLMCVGDDWQAIYRFAGSDVTLFTNFERLVGYHEKLRIERTYRNSQQLVDVASRFVLKNPDQIPKNMVALPEKSLETPINIVGVDDRQSAFLFALNNILSLPNMGGKITVLGRNKADIGRVFPEEVPHGSVRIVPASKLHGEAGSADAMIYYRYEGAPSEIAIEYRTVHKSKGLEADNVIVANLENSMYGFPNMIEDDPILDLLLADSDNYPFSEERRLFYVAITRTKNSVWLVCPSDVGGRGQSQFVTELREEGGSAVGYYCVPSDREAARCPRCGGALIVRTNDATGEQFVGCTNYPFCDMTYKDVRVIADNATCPECGGHLTRRRNGKTGEEFLGCTNYPEYCYFTCELEDLDALKKGLPLPSRKRVVQRQWGRSTEYAHVKFGNTPNRTVSSSTPTCKRCGTKMVLRDGPHGKFYGCPNYPSCTYTLDYKGSSSGKVFYHSVRTGNGSKKASGHAPKCPKCGKTMVIRHGPNGDFYGCSAYPKCKGTRSMKQ